MPEGRFRTTEEQRRPVMEEVRMTTFSRGRERLIGYAVCGALLTTVIAEAILLSGIANYRETSWVLGTALQVPIVTLPLGAIAGFSAFMALKNIRGIVSDFRSKPGNLLQR